MKRKIIHSLLALFWICQQGGFIQAAPVAGAVAGPAADWYRPMQLVSVTVDPVAGLFSFSARAGESAGTDAARLLGYFKTGMSLPNDCFWVNLRPDGADRMLDPRLEHNAVAKVLLEADVQLKKDLAALTDPDTVTGKQYWNKVYERAGLLFGQDAAMQIPALARPWIVPAEMIIAETPQTAPQPAAFICKAMLKVCLEEDYLPGYAADFSDPRIKQLNEYSSELLRSLIIPSLTRQVNSARRYAALRQVFNCLILAQWVKERFSDRVFSFPADASQDAGLQPWSKSDYFRQYSDSFDRGEYRKEDVLAQAGGLVIRQYASGGIQAFLQDKRGVIRVPTHLVQRVLSALPDLVPLAAVSAEPAPKQTSVQSLLSEVLGEEAVRRAQSSQAGLEEFETAAQYLWSLQYEEQVDVGAILSTLCAIVGVPAVAQCLVDDPYAVAMLVERLSSRETMRFFSALADELGASALRLALLADPAGFVEGFLDRAEEIQSDIFLATMRDVFARDGAVVARALLARCSGWLAELIVQLSDSERMAWFRQEQKRTGRQSMLDAIALEPDTIVEAVYTGNNDDADASIASVRQTMRRYRELIDHSDGAGFAAALERIGMETDSARIGSVAGDLFKLRNLLYPDNSGLVELDPNMQTLVIPDVHSRRQELLQLLQQSDASGVSNLDKVLSGRLQLVVLGDLVHSEDSSRWEGIVNELKADRREALDRELADSLGTVALVLMLKARSPKNVHWLRGNHDAVKENVYKYTDYGGGEGALVRGYIEEKFGENFVDSYARLEKQLPLMARLKGRMLISHSEPGASLSEEEVLVKTGAAVHGLTWARENGTYSRQALKNILGTEDGLYIAGHTPQRAGLEVLPESRLLLINDPGKLHCLLIDSHQAVHDLWGPVWNFDQFRQGPAYPLQRSHRSVNEYIAAHLPEQVNAKMTANGYGVQARVIPIEGLLVNTGQFGHIGLGQAYGEPVIYIDAGYLDDMTVRGHELFEIAQWEKLRQSKKLSPGDMRQWIIKNLDEANQLARQWHQQAPALDELFARANIKAAEEFDDPYADEIDDPNLGAQRQTSLDDFAAQAQPLVFAMEQENGMSIYRADDYETVVSSRMLSEYRRAVARIFVFRSINNPDDRVVIINSRGAEPLSDAEVIAYAKIGAYQKQHQARPTAGNRDSYLGQMRQILASDDRQAFKDALVIADGSFRYFKNGALRSKELKEFPLRNESRLKGLIGWMQEGRFHGGSIQGESGKWYAEQQFFDAVKEEAVAQTLDVFADGSARDGGTQQPTVQDPGGIDLRRLIGAEKTISVDALAAGMAQEQIELFLSGCAREPAQQLRECLRLDDHQRGLACVLQLLEQDQKQAVSTHPGLLFLLSRMAE